MVIRYDINAVVESSVLLVHDDLTWLRAASEMLRGAGFEVVLASSGAVALHHVNQGFRPAVLVTAVRMVGIGGPELSRAVLEVSPATAVVLVAALPPHAVDLADAPAAMMLVEPFGPDDLLACVCSVLWPDMDVVVDDLTGDSGQDTPDTSIPFDMSWSLIAAAVLISASWLVGQLLWGTRLWH